MKALLGLALIITLVGTGYALQCYVCNSHLDKDCKDLTSPNAKNYLKECNNEPDGEKYTLCRKIDMHMDMDYGKFHEKENRVHRACGWEENVDSSKDCYYKSGYNTRSWVCACKTDGCNGASLPSVGFAVLLPVIIAAVLRMDVVY
ncbi:uncharacterized protein [Macrobrachium rosenbergii]|uniref:uncharacterized protein n=1 Tax=Macrobrachium rosenbergii TaxID=79674 RepID=UPI0034D6054F